MSLTSIGPVMLGRLPAGRRGQLGMAVASALIMLAVAAAVPVD